MGNNPVRNSQDGKSWKTPQSSLRVGTFIVKETEAQSYEMTGPRSCDYFKAHVGIWGRGIFDVVVKVKALI